MKFPTKDNPIYNLSRPLVVLVATLVGAIFHSAIAQAQTTTERVDYQQFSLPIANEQLVAQVWSDVHHRQLSLAKPEFLDPASNKQLLTQLPADPAIAQAWSEVDPQKLSLAASAKPTASISIAQLLLEQQLLAQVWSEIDRQQLSLAKPESESVILIAQLLPKQQQLIAQIWSEIDVEALTLAVPDLKSETAELLLITQLLPEQQQLIAQIWSEVANRELSLAAPTSDRQALASRIEIAQLLPSERELIAQVWSEIDSDKLSLIIAEPFATQATQTEAPIPVAPEFSAAPKLDAEQQLLAQAWAEADRQELSLAPAIEQFDRIAVLSSPFIEQTPATRVPSKEEVAARIVLNKVQIITPAPGVIIDGTANNSSVTVQYPARTTVALEINGKPVDNALITREQLDFKTNVVTQTWQGTSLKEGLNNVSVIASKSGFSNETTREVIVKSDSSESSATDTDEPEVQSEVTEPAPNVPKSTLSENYSQGLVKILTPKANAVLENISSTVVIQFPEEAKVILQVNDKPVNASQAGRTEINPITKIVTQTWYGVIFDTGENKLSVLATTDGQKYSETAIAVVVPGQPDALKVSTIESHVPADGQSIARVKGKFIDKEGATAIWDEIVTLNSSDGQFVGTDLEPDLPGFQVKTNKGEFIASLQTGFDPKKVTIQAKARDLEAYTQIQFKNTLRERPLLTGFANVRIGAQGTDYYDSFRDFLPLDEDNSATVDFDSAAFLTGSLGRWTYTGAYNSDRSLNEDSRGENRIFRSYSNSEEQYPIYGDSSTTEVVTPSISRVYFRLERNSKIELADTDFFIWGGLQHPRVCHGVPRV